MSADRRRDRVAQAAIIAWATIGWLIVAGGVFWLLKLVAPALVPFMMGGVLFLMLRWPVNAMEARGMRRVWAVLVCYLLMFAVISVFSTFVVPAVIAQLQQFSSDLPRYYRLAEAWWTGVQGQAESIVLPEWVRSALVDAAKAITSRLGAIASSVAGGVLSAGQSAATLVVDLVLALVIGFWALKDMPKVRAEVMQLVGEHRRGEADMIAETVLRVLGGYIRGQIIVSAVTGVLVWLGLALVGVPYALVLGLVTGLLNVVPYVGPFIGGLSAAVVGLFISPLTGLLAIAVVLGAQQLTDIFITPRVMSEQVDLHPLLVIFSLLVGGTLFGFLGLILAIPVAAIIKGLFVYYYEKHTDKVLGTEDGVLFRSKPADDEAGTDEAEETKNVGIDAKNEETDA